jgi:hypothetical protein
MTVRHHRLKPVPQVREYVDIKPDLWHRLQPVMSASTERQ